MNAELIGAGEVEPAQLEHMAGIFNEILASENISIETCTVAGCDPRKLRAAFQKASSRYDLVLAVGGLGLGPEGNAKETLAAFLGRRLVLHQETLKRIQTAYARAGRNMPQAASRLAAMPEQSIVFPGQKGITPGCGVSLGKKQIILLPDLEREAVPMVQACVAPYLARLSGGGGVIRVVNIFGLSEEEVHEKIEPKYGSLRNPTVSVRSKQGEVQAVISTQANSKAEASMLAAPVIKGLLGMFGEYAYGVDQVSLQNVVIGSLRANRMTIASAEDGTEGLLEDLLEETDSSGRIYLKGFQGPLAVPEKILKKYGSASPQTAAAMAKGAMETTHASFGIAAAGDGKHFFGAVCDSRAVWTVEVDVPERLSEAYLQRMLVLAVLDFARRVIAALPQRYEGATSLVAAAEGKLAKPFSAKIPIPPGQESKKKKKKKEKREKKRGGFLSSIFPFPGDSFGEVLRKVVLIIAVCTFFGSAGYLGVYYYQSFSNQKLSEAMADQYEAGIIASERLEVPDNYPEDYQRKFANLYGINQDIGAWLKIPDTLVNYPVVFYEPDNLYYSRRDFTGKSNRHGVPWIEARCTLNPQCDNYIVYGHNMTDGQMFGELIKYKPSGEGLEFLKAHPIISMDDVYRDNDYKIMSVFISTTNPKYGGVFYYNYFTDLSNEQNFNNFVKEVTDRSFYISNVDVQPGDKFITLSTCSYEYGPVSDNADVRTVVVGRRVREGEKNDGSDILYQLNPSPKVPEGFSKEIAAGAHAGDAAQYIRSQGTKAAQQAAAPAAGQQETSASQQESLTSQQEKPDIPVMAEASRPSEPATAITTDPVAESMKAAQASSSQAALDAARAAASEEAERQAWAAAQASQAAQEAEAARQAEQAKAAASASEAARLAAEAKAASDAAEEERASMAALEAAASREAELEAQAAKEKEEAEKLSNQQDSSSREEDENEEENQDKDSNDKVSDPGGPLTIYASGSKRSGSAEELIPQIVMNEMGAGFSQEALKAQAVAAYSYVRYQNAHGIVPTFYLNTPSSDVAQACQSVLGQAVYSGGSIAFTPFYATSAGVTAASSDVWGGSYSYLVPVDSSVDERANGYEKSVSLSANEVAAKVKSAMKVDLYAYSDNPDDWFGIESYTEGEQYVKEIRVGDKTTSGRAFREQVMNLRSAAFDIDYDGSRFTFTTRGYGHGVGMSQNGANFYAKDGWSYTDILEHYYPGTQVQ